MRQTGHVAHMGKTENAYTIFTEKPEAKKQHLRDVGYSHTTARRMVPAYTKCDVQLIKVAPDDGLI